MARKSLVAGAASVFLRSGMSPLVCYHRRLERERTHAVHALKDTGRYLLSTDLPEVKNYSLNKIIVFTYLERLLLSVHAQVTNQIRRFLEFLRTERTRVPPYVSYAALLYGEIFPASMQINFPHHNVHSHASLACQSIFYSSIILYKMKNVHNILSFVKCKNV